jgi:hypothetical protein
MLALYNLITMDFYIASIFILAITIGPAIIDFIKNHQFAYRRHLLLVIVAGAIGSFCMNYSAHSDAVRTDSLYQKLLHQNLDSANKIIDTVNYALKNTKNLLIQNDSILREQATSAQSLNSQLHVSQIIQKNVITSGENLVKQVDKTRENLKDRITGGDAYCIPEILNLGKGAYQVSLTNKFPFAIPNVSINICNYDSVLQCASRIIVDKRFYNHDCSLKHIVYYQNVNFSSGTGKSLTGTEPLIKNGNTLNRLLISFSTATNIFLYQILYRLDNNMQAIRYRIFKYNNKRIEVIKEVPSTDPYLNSLDWIKTFPDTDINMRN